MRAPGAAGRRRATRRAQRARCCRRARRSRPPPCTRTTARHRRLRTEPDWIQSGRRRARRSTQRTAGSSRSSAWSLHEHVDARRVAAADLEPVDRREAPAGSRGSRRALPAAAIAAGERADFAGGAEPVVADRPEHIAQCDRSGAGRSRPSAASDRRARARRRMLGGDASSRSRRAVIPATSSTVTGEGERRRARPQEQRVDVCACSGATVGVVRRADRGNGSVEPAESVAASRHGRVEGRAEDADDAAHDRPGYRHRNRLISGAVQPGRRSRMSRGECPRRARTSELSVGASTITRTSGSVPLGRTRMRPVSPSSRLGGGDLGGEHARRCRDDARTPAR